MCIRTISCVRVCCFMDIYKQEVDSNNSMQSQSWKANNHRCMVGYVLNVPSMSLHVQAPPYGLTPLHYQSFKYISLSGLFAS